MRKKMLITTFFISITLLPLFSCSDKASFSGSSVEKAYVPDDPNINYVPENITKEEYDEIIKDISTMSQEELLKYAEVKGKSVKTCMFFSWKYTNHHCDDAKFKVVINGKDLGELNLNNRQPREVITLKTKRTLDVGTVSMQFRDTPRDPPDDDYVITDVPGTLFESSWDSEGRLNVNTVCNTEEERCHTDTSSFALIGTLDINYKKLSIKKTFRSRLNILYTDKPVSYNFKDLKLEELDNKNYEFDDWCKIIEVN